jgi:hypothetical protein
MAGLCVALNGPALADDTEGEPKVLPLESYEPNTIGFTWDSDDVRFMDFKLSVKYPLMPRRLCSVTALHDSRFYFAATARFAQYLGTRESSPVIGKRFNPKLIWRVLTSPDDHSSSDEECMDKGRKHVRDYLDFAFNHESNGQSIDSPQLLQEAIAQAERPEFARDNISRGWDYLEMVHKHTWHKDGEEKFASYLTLKYFLPRGPLQGTAEEYNAWENDPEGKPRRRVHGVGLLLKYESDWDPNNNWSRHPKLAFGYETGYSHAFKYSTVRGEAGIKLWELPLTAFAQYGYGSDLAQYYKKVRSYGVFLEIASF